MVLVMTEKQEKKRKATSYQLANYGIEYETVAILYFLNFEVERL